MYHFLLTIIQAPSNSLIIAHSDEDEFYAYLGLSDAILKLATSMLCYIVFHLIS